MTVTDPRRLVRGRLQALATQVPRAVAGEVEGVHQARVASRRLRELLPLFAVTPDGLTVVRALRKDVRTMTRVMGPVREIDVSMMTLEDVAAQHAEHVTAAALARNVLEGQRITASARMIDVLTSADLDDLAARAWRVATSLVAPPARRRIATALAARIGARARAVQAALDAAGAVYAPDRLHRIRIALKKLRYALELAEDVGGLRLHGTLARLKSLQDVLGLLHDREVLAASVRDCTPDLAASGTEPALTALIRTLDDEIRRQHSRFLTVRPSLRVVFHWAEHAQRQLGLCAHTRRRRPASSPQAAPLTADAPD